MSPAVPAKRDRLSLPRPSVSSICSICGLSPSRQRTCSRQSLLRLPGQDRLVASTRRSRRPCAAGTAPSRSASTAPTIPPSQSAAPRSRFCSATSDSRATPATSAQPAVARSDRPQAP